MSHAKVKVLETKMESLERKSVSANLGNFVYVWKISQWAEKGKCDLKFCVRSKKFYIHEPGHHAQLVLYPNDPSDGFVGLYLGFEEGDYDDIIDCPFSFEFSITIINQQPNGNDKTVDFNKEENEVNFVRRTVGASSFGSGFLSHEEIAEGKYVRNDTLFVKLVVFM
eukprot:m.5369 g.5369  ORF g.5369 m.5369 type:complete len:167 (+) comp12965_c0_seq1:678-1178(+)